MNRSYIKKWKKSLVLLFSAFLLASCNRTIPAASADLLKEKKSLLLITAASVAQEETERIGTTLRKTAASEQIAFEWVKQASAFGAALAEQTSAKPYDRVLVIGEELFAGAAEAAKTQRDKRFTLFQASRYAAALPSVSDLPNVKWKRLDERSLLSPWDDWVASQRALGLNLLWVNRTAEPVPSAWAPSEEAETIFTIDQYPDSEWFSQLSYQAHSIQANWIVLYSPVEAAVANRIKTLRIPLLDLNGGLSVEYVWETILQEELRGIKTDDWHGGTVPYSDQEIRINRK